MHPHLEYAAPVWDPHKLKDVKSLEDTQKFALRMCLKEWSCDYQEVLELSSFPTLQNRRCYQKLTTLFKIVNHLLVFPPDKVQKKHQARPSLHPNSDHMLHHPFARTTASQFSFIPHTVSVWNNLPSEALQAASLRKFKSSIAPLLLTLGAKNAERVTVVVSCVRVCVSVCMYVCPNTLFWQYAQLEV